MSNALAIKFSGDPSNPKLCARVLIMTGTCETTGSCETTGFTLVTNYNVQSTGVTWVTGYTVQEWCSPIGINDNCSGTTYVNEEHWVLINVVFERNIWWDECDLLYKGGLGTIFFNPYTASTVQNTVSLIEPPITHDGIFAAKSQIYNLNTKWLLEKLYRAGTLKFYVNGKLFWKIDDFEEIIPRPLDAPKERQAGVPYNFSWGGGTQGLHDNLVFKQPPTSLTGNTYQQDPEAFSPSILSGTSLSALTTNIMIEQNFAGTFEGAVSQFRMYTKALSVPEIQHNFRILKDKFKLYDPFCPNCLIPGIPIVSSTPTLTLTPTKTPTETEVLTSTPTPTVTKTPTNTPSPTPLVTTFNVTNSGASSYIINGSSNPTLNLYKGQTYTFNIVATNHPFWIKTTPVIGTGSAYTNGISSNGITNGIITFTVPYDAPSTLYYICQFHESMQGVINIINVPEPSQTPTPTPTITNSPTPTSSYTPIGTPTPTPTIP
jgi:Predicted solute binding protein